MCEAARTGNFLYEEDDWQSHGLKSKGRLGITSAAPSSARSSGSESCWTMPSWLIQLYRHFVIVSSTAQQATSFGSGSGLERAPSGPRTCFLHFHARELQALAHSSRICTASAAPDVSETSQYVCIRARGKRTAPIPLFPSSPFSATDARQFYRKARRLASRSIIPRGAYIYRSSYQCVSFHSGDPASRTFTGCACVFSREAIRRAALRTVLYIIYYRRIRICLLV
jgi:hypothetical protein